MSCKRPPSVEDESLDRRGLFYDDKEKEILDKMRNESQQTGTKKGITIPSAAPANT